jgi:hypothetical protein
MTFGTILRINKKGGDVHGKIPMRIGTTGSFCQTHRARFFAPLRMTIGPRGFAEGNRTVPGPGRSYCEELRFLVSLGTSSAISERAA